MPRKHLSQSIHVGSGDDRRVRRGLKVLAAGLLAGSLSIAVWTPTAPADNLDDQAQALQNQIQASDGDILGDTSALDAASQALRDSQVRLADAQATKARADSDLVAAQEMDAQMAANLAQAETELAAAQAAVEQGQADVKEQLRVVGQNVRQTTQQSTTMTGIGLMFTNLGTGDFNDRLQWSQTLFNATQRQLDTLQAAELKLEAAEQAKSAAEQQAQHERQAAADHLVVTQQAQAAAQQAADAVTNEVAANQAAQAKAQDALNQARTLNEQLKQQAAAVQQSIQERNAAAAAEAARQAQLAQTAAAQRAAALAQAAAAGSAAIHYSTASGLIDPVPGAPVTSPYQRRLNPVLGVWEFHDGTDLGGYCGQPILAAAAGQVAQVLSPAQSGGYGNRMVIDHGLMNGQYVSTGYNHAQSYVVGVGQHVDQGQVIGYVGTTGLSTGCHLHFHVYVNGHTVDPQSMVNLG